MELFKIVNTIILVVLAAAYLSTIHKSWQAAKFINAVLGENLIIAFIKSWLAMPWFLLIKKFF